MTRSWCVWPPAHRKKYTNPVLPTFENWKLLYRSTNVDSTNEMRATSPYTHTYSRLVCACSVTKYVRKIDRRLLRMRDAMTAYRAPVRQTTRLPEFIRMHNRRATCRRLVSRSTNTHRGTHVMPRVFAVYVPMCSFVHSVCESARVCALKVFHCTN